MKYILLFVLIFAGCQDKTYSRIYKKEEVGAKIPTLSISDINQTIKTIAIKAIKNANFKVESGTPYVLEIDGATYPKKCNNPNTSTYEATYDGYIKLTLLKNMKRIYMCQKDYHGTLTEKVVEDLLDKMKDDLNLDN